MSMGTRIRRLRNELGYSQAELGKRSGVSRVAVTQWENNQTIPETPHLMKLAAALNTTTGFILSGDKTTDIPKIETFSKEKNSSPWTMVPEYDVHVSAGGGALYGRQGDCNGGFSSKPEANIHRSILWRRGLGVNRICFACSRYYFTSDGGWACCRQSLRCSKIPRKHH